MTKSLKEKSQRLKKIKCVKNERAVAQIKLSGKIEYNSSKERIWLSAGGSEVGKKI